MVDALKDVNPSRKTVKILLFDALLTKGECVLDKLHYVKSITESIEKSLFEELYSKDDKPTNYLQRAKSIVFNLGVCLN